MAGPMDQSKLQGLLLQSKLAAVTAHGIRDRMLQLQVRLQAHTTAGTTATTTTPAGAGAAGTPSEDVTATGAIASSGGSGAALPSKDVTATGATTSSGSSGAALPSKDVTDTTTGESRSFEDEIVSGLHDAYMVLEKVARYKTSCIIMAAKSGVPPSLPTRFSVISDEQLYEEMLALRLPEPPTTQIHAFARLEAAFYVVKLPQKHHLDRCVHHLRRPGQVGMHQALTYLGRACTFASLAVTHIDLAVTAIESFVDPKDVADISDFATSTATRHLSHRYR